MGWNLDILFISFIPFGTLHCLLFLVQRGGVGTERVQVFYRFLGILNVDIIIVLVIIIPITVIY